MQLRVRLFASLREAAGLNELSIEVPPHASVESCWATLAERFPALAGKRARLSAAVNRRYVAFDATLHEDDEVVFIPPVSGG
jgi:molybdopterin converting factor subunit 1